MTIRFGLLKIWNFQLGVGPSRASQFLEKSAEVDVNVDIIADGGIWNVENEVPSSTRNCDYMRSEIRFP